MKSLYYIFALVLCFSLAACEEHEPFVIPKPVKPVTPPTTPTTPTPPIYTLVFSYWSDGKIDKAYVQK